MMVSEILVPPGTEKPTPKPKPTPKKNRPADTPIRQQRLLACQPVSNFKTTWLRLCITGLLFLISGSLLLYISIQHKEIRVTYSSPDDTACTRCINDLRMRRGKCKACTKTSREPCTCTVKFDIDSSEELKFPVFVYYEIENFYQNHRKYVKSRDDYQLLGNIGTPDNPTEPDSNCAPFAKDSNNKRYFPCGAIANSMFSDSLELYKTGESTKVNMSYKIDNTFAPDIERKYKFKNPSGAKNLEEFRKKYSDHFVRPLDWTEEFWKQWWNDGALQNDRFISWMRPASHSTFRKLYGIINTSISGCSKKQYLCHGSYDLKITYRFDADRFKGKKHVILAKTSFLGGENRFIGGFTMLVGLVMLIFGIIFFSIHRRHKRVHPEHRRLSLNRNPNQEVPVPQL